MIKSVAMPYGISIDEIETILVSVEANTDVVVVAYGIKKSEMSNIRHSTTIVSLSGLFACLH